MTDDADEQAIRDSGRGHLIDGGPHRGQVERLREVAEKFDAAYEAVDRDACYDAAHITDDPDFDACYDAAMKASEGFNHPLDRTFYAVKATIATLKKRGRLD